MPTNAKNPGKWPQFAAGCKDEAKFLSKRIVETAKAAQLAVLGGQSGEAIILCGDIRDLANGIVWQMVQAESGVYEESAAVQDAETERRGRAVGVAAVVPDRGGTPDSHRVGPSRC